MSIVTNYLLFNHTFLAQLQSDSSLDGAALPIIQGMRDWYNYRDNTSIPGLVDSWIGPILQILELNFQPLSPSSPAHAIPSYLLYPAWQPETPVGLCCVTPPGADLDITVKSQHWMAQAALAARAGRPQATDSQTAVRWVILTNGDQWRLLDAQSLRRYEAYLQIDVDQLVKTPGDLSAVRIFYRCFHRTAFEGNDKGRSGLDDLLDASNQATRQAEEHLRARVSHEEGIMARLCRGLVQATGQSSFSETERDDIYRNATYLLYRMLFISYAEARGLLPLDNPAYRAASLTRLIETATAYKQRGIPDPQATTLWDRLKRLCTAIYASDVALNIPSYNGGLFDDADKLHLRTGYISDAHLTEALFDLAYRPDAAAPDGRQVIDYRDLSVRHLGSLYEGMIEYKLHIAQETLWARRDGKGNVRFLQTGQEGAPRKTDMEIKPGGVYFSQSPGERRATGTYYTPEYIVDYIVRQTVVKGLEERRKPLEDKLQAWMGEMAVASSGERTCLQRTLDEALLCFVEEQVLTFRVCDPAMGSGHFLVNAAHQMANFVIETLYLDWASNGQRPTSEIDADPVAWRRRVVEHCLYGVDLSLMAVELAKLSLWLASVAEGRPLSFLDHHLRQGNSLIGARLEDLAEALDGTSCSQSPHKKLKEQKARKAGQLSMLDDPGFAQHVTAATDLLARISARVAETVEDVKAQEADYEQMRAELEPYRRLADLWTARYFGLKMDEGQLHEMVKCLANGTVSLVPRYQRLLTQAQELAKERCFFHWTLEFPEVFFGPTTNTMQVIELKGNGGFDAVVENPPYLSVEKLGIEDKAYFIATNSAIVYKRFDAFGLFIYHALTIYCKYKAPVGVIVPTTMFDNLAYRPLRRFLRTQATLSHIWNLGGYVFEGVNNDTCVFITVRGLIDNAKVQLRDTSYGRDITTIVPVAVAFVGGDDVLSTKTSNDVSRVVEQMRRISDNFNLYIETATQGLVTGNNPAFIITRSELSEYEDAKHLIRSLTFGREIGRYEQSEPDEYVIYLTRDTSGQLPASVYNRLIPLRDQLSARREVKKGVIPWYALQWPRSECILERRDALLFQIIRNLGLERRLIAAENTYGAYADHTLNVVIVKRDGVSSRYCLALLNSALLNWFFQNQHTDINIKLSYLRDAPIRRISFTTPAVRRKALVEHCRQLHAAAMQDPSLPDLEGSKDIIMLIRKCLDAQPEESDVVHDLLSFLAQQMIDLNKERQRLEGEADLFCFVDRATLCRPFDKALGVGELILHPQDPSLVHHDIEELRLSQEPDGRWLLELQAKLRDPASDWCEHQRDSGGGLIRQWLPVYRLPLDEAMGRFYHYAFANLKGFDGAGKFPGGATLTLLEKLHAAMVPKYISVDLAPLAALETELAETRRKIQFTDDLIDQIVYRLYGLTEKEIAIVEGRA